MLRFSSRELDVPLLMQRLTAAGGEGEGAPSLDEKLEIARAIRGHSREAGAQLDRFLLETVARLRGGLDAAQENQDKLKAVLEKLSATPWHPATFLGAQPTPQGPAAMVMHGSTRRVVALAEDLDVNTLTLGDEVLLGQELNVVMGKSPYRAFQCGETATFERYAADGRAVLRSRDEEIVVELGGALAEITLRNGDLVRWDRNIWMACEKIERDTAAHRFLEEIPAETFADIGGLDAQIASLQRTIRLHLYHAETVRKYRLRRKGSVLLVGPPGTGKTMMARALANWLGQVSRSGRARFMNIKPASLHSVWYSQSEANYREAFRVAREAGEEEPEIPVVMFFDEVDAIGGARGASWMRVDDRVLTAFMTELDGLESRGNILVVAATNRRDALDPALLRPGRLGDLVLEIPRPNRRAARDTFGKYLHPDLPYDESGPGSDPESFRQTIIEAAVSRIYSPNGESDLATITFRDGKRRSIQARDLVSGAGIAQIARSAMERACLREIESGPTGLQVQDLLTAAGEELERAARALTPANCHQYLSELPQDVDVVRVEPVERKVSRPHRYLSVA